GKIQYVPSNRDVVNLDLNRSRTRFAVPFDSVEGVIDDHQQDVNGFVNLGWRHRFDAGTTAEAGRSSELFAGAFFRDGSLNYTPGLSDDPTFVFFPDTTHYILSEDRNFHTEGLKLDYTLQPHHGLEFKGGVLASYTGGHENFASVSKTGSPGPTSDSDLNGSDVGVYAQTAIAPSDKWELRTGVRFDNHNAPFAGNQHQVSPRAKLSFFPDPGNTLYAYYGRLFMPTNVEDLRAITSIALNHAYGRAPITGGFFPADTTAGLFDLDHDQRLSGVASVVYASHGFYLSTNATYGSGLTNGNSPDSTYGTGLFDFNKSIKVAPSFILNASAGYTWAVGNVVIRPQLYVDNVFDHKYLLKGAFFSGASVGRPRDRKSL